jgi:flagellar biosynthesis protein FlhB
MVINMNLMQVLMPANVQYFFTFLVNIVTFKLFSPKIVINKIMGYKDAILKKDDTRPELAQSGFDGGNNIMINLGVIFIGIVAVCLLIGFFALINFLS